MKNQVNSYVDAIGLGTQGSVPLMIFEGHHDCGFAADWHPNGLQFATGNDDQTTAIWDLRCTLLLVSIHPYKHIHMHIHTFMCTHPYNHIHMHTFMCRSLKAPVKIFESETTAVRTVKFSNSGRYLACAESEDTVVV